MPRSGWAREPQMLSLRVWSLCPATGGAAIEKGPRTAMKSGPRTAMKSGPRLPQLEKALARTEDPTQPKIKKKKKPPSWDFPGGAVVKNPPANAGDMGSSAGPGRSHMLWSN